MITILIKQTRINSCRYFALAPPNSPIYVRVDNAGRFERQLRAFGFQDADESGTSILPCSVNRYAKKNAEVFFTIDKSLPKEDYIQTVYWTRYEWAGRGEVNPVTDFSYIKKQRYHRDYFCLLYTSNSYRDDRHGNGSRSYWFYSIAESRFCQLI